jgi:membrane fusion protein (multidrug efflux system)
MSATFTRTLRSLEAGGGHRRGVGLLLLALAGVGLAWSLFGQVTVYEVTDRAWLEAQSAPHPVAAPVDGRVIASRLILDGRVRAGDVLVVLDDEPFRRKRAQKQAEKDAILAKRKNLPRQLREARKKLRFLKGNRPVKLDIARWLAQVASLKADFDERRVANAGAACEKAPGAIASEEVMRNRKDARVSRLSVDIESRDVVRLEYDLLIQESDQQATIVKLKGEKDELDAALVAADAGIRELEYDIELRTIRAPVDGRVGEVTGFQVGSVVRAAADRLGTIVPEEEQRAVALFPAAAVGRIRGGQAARLRLQGFPWTQYGTVAATVANVGSEPSNGLIRVEFVLAADPSSRIPMGHGQPGSAEVAIEQVSPATLALRAAGQLLGATRWRGDNANERGGP